VAGFGPSSMEFQAPYLDQVLENVLLPRRATASFAAWVLLFRYFLQECLRQQSDFLVFFFILFFKKKIKI